jgi:hypothetical protein
VPFTSAWALRKEPLSMVVPAAALALDCDFCAWAISGMDTPIFAAACAAAIALATSRPKAAATLLGALAWVRPEGLLVGALGVGALALARERRSPRRAMVLAACAAAPVALLVALRLVYFRDVLPNTFYAKMGPGAGDYTGAGYLLSELARRPVLIALPLLLFALRRLRLAPQGAVALAIAAGVFAFAFVAGGDWMFNRRLLVPALPALALAVAAALPSWRFAGVYAGALLFAEAAWTTDRALDQRWRKNETLDRRLDSFVPPPGALRAPYPLDWMPAHLMDQIAPYAGPGDWVAHVDVGQLPYVMRDVRFVDGFGLVDREAGRVAFRPNDAEYTYRAREAFFARAPRAAIVVLHKETRLAIAPAQAAVLADPRFFAAYTKLSEVPTWGGHACVTYVRSELTPAPPEVAEARVRDWLGSAPGVVRAP